MDILSSSDRDSSRRRDGWQVPRGKDDVGLFNVLCRLSRWWIVIGSSWGLRSIIRIIHVGVRKQ